MSQLTKYLEDKIQELTASIDAQKMELEAYENVLRMETRGSATPNPVSRPPASGSAQPSGSRPQSSSIDNSGSKTNTIVEVVKSFGKSGATPKDVDTYFTQHNISRSKNLIYNTLSYLVLHNKMQRKDGKYFFVAGGGSSASKSAPAATKSAPVAKKRQLSPEGLKKIREAMKKRWAKQAASKKS